MSNDEPGPRPADGSADDASRSDEGDSPESTGSPMIDRGGASNVSDAETAENADGADDSVGDGEAEVGESADGAMNAKKQDTGKKSGSFWKELPILIVVALVLAFVIKTWVVQAFYIPSGSMENTLLVNDRVLVNKLVYQVRDIQRGDVVVFTGGHSWDEDNNVDVPEPTNPVSKLFTWVGQQFGVEHTGKDYIKRVIGVPGDTVQCCDSENRVTVNGEPLNEPYLYPDSQKTHTEFGPVTVPKGRLWVMGDHREISQDSRKHQNNRGSGTIAEEDVVGRAFVLVWPLDRWEGLSPPDTFDSLNDKGEQSSSGN